MTGRKGKLDIAVSVLLLFFCALLLRAQCRSTSATSTIDRVVNGIAAPLRTGTYWAIEGVGDVFSRYGYLVGVDEQNADLRGEIRRLRSLLAQANMQLGELEKLRTLVALRGQSLGKMVSTRVISAPMSSQFRVVSVQATGDVSEVARGMPVIAPVTVNGRVVAALAGRVERVTGKQMTVMLINDVRSFVDVVVRPGKQRGILQGDPFGKGYRGTVQWVEQTEEVRVGDVIETSGFGGVFPPGISVGVVHQARVDTNQLFQEITVRPFANFSSLETLLVVTAPAGTSKGALKEERIGPRAGLARPF